MHPVFVNPRRFAAYLGVWLPLIALLAYGLTASQALTGIEAVAVAVPLGMVYAFGCLAVWYLCRVLPLSPDNWSRALGVHVLAALVEAALWTLIAEAIAAAGANYGPFPDLTARLSPDLPLVFGTGLLLYWLAAAAYYLILASEASRAAEARVLQAGMLAREAELRALKAQINPHFLFNSLNSVSALTATDPARAREMCVLLGDFLRRTLGLGEKAAIPLAEELSLVHAFLAVEKVRFGDRIQMQECIAADASMVTLPPLLLQPLVENAVVHGVSHLVEGGWVRLEIRRVEGRLAIQVDNNFDPDAPPRRRSGVGLGNVRKRLWARYGSEAELEVHAQAGVYRVTMTLPLEATP